MSHEVTPDVRARPLFPGRPQALHAGRDLGGKLRRVQDSGAPAHPLPAGMRDLLPEEALRQSQLGRAAVNAFSVCGYERITLPVFEYAEVLERGLGALDPREVLRFVEPESGEVVALRPDMTPQIARLVVSRLAAAPLPIRLCYEGSVVRLRRERARRHRQIPQAGIELVGRPGLAGDVEVVGVASRAVRAAGLRDFTVDLGHPRIAGALLDVAPAEHRSALIEALSVKDSESLARLAAAAGVDATIARALVALAELSGEGDVWSRAHAVLGSTPAAPALAELEGVAEAVAPLVPTLVVDLGEVRHLAYYTGVTFQILAEGPGEAVGSGGRYDGLFARFGRPTPAAGCALDLDNLAWALGAATEHGVRARVLVALEDATELLEALRSRGVPAAVGNGAALDYARAWRYSHVLDAKGLTRVSDGVTERLNPSTPAEVAVEVQSLLLASREPEES